MPKNLSTSLARNIRISEYRDGAIAARSISKSFGPAAALRDISVTVEPGEVLAIVGENGAGKSTLIACLTGALRPDSGRITVGGHEYSSLSPQQAIAERIAAIRQEPMLVPTLSVAENVLLGARVSRLFAWRASLRREAVRRLDLADAAIDPDAIVERLSPADRQLVEIARAVGAGAKVLFFDEPTAALTPAETERLFQLIRRLRDEGVAIAYVSHRLEEILDITDRVVVLRDGRIVDAGLTRDFDEARLVNSMAGRHVQLKESGGSRSRAAEGIRLSVRGLRSRRLEAADVEVGIGEIVGVAGIVGSGRSRLLSVIAGDAPARAGELTLSGRSYRPRSPRDALQRGVALVTEDRHRTGLFLELDQAENVAFSSLRRLSKWGLTSPRARRRHTAHMLQLLSVHPSNPRLAAGVLSGGNQQKLLLGRALMLEPELLLLDEPTKGVDVSAKADIHHLIVESAESGCGVLVVSSDLRELVQLCDRIVVMARGRTVGQFERPFDPVAIMHAAVADSSLPHNSPKVDDD